MHTTRSKYGFTLLEIVIVIAVVALIAAIGAVAMSSMRDMSALKTSTDEVYRAFTDARNRTLASEEDTTYGIFLNATSVTRFAGTTYDVADPTNEVFEFMSGVRATSTLITNATPIIFRRLSGEPSTTGTIYVHSSDGSATNTLVIHPAGLIEY